MPENIVNEPNTLVPLTSYVVSAYVSNHRVGATELPEIIAAVHVAFESIYNPQPDAPAEQFTPAVSVRKSLSNPDKIISMIDGKPYTSLSRHLSAKGITPKEYRSRYNLPADYPMVAPGYSERRSVLARAIGLGRKASIGLIGAATEIVSAVLTTADQPAATDAEPGVSSDDGSKSSLPSGSTEHAEAPVETAASAKPKRGRPRNVKSVTG
jgi:predicted transcriptional regulator